MSAAEAWSRADLEEAIRMAYPRDVASLAIALLDAPPETVEAVRQQLKQLKQLKQLSGERSPIA